jgi:threonylcarbamoyladenosine tRNA methylthiotransferase MtaB
MKKVAFHTLGCKLNFAETSSIAKMFEENDFEKVKFQDKADVYIINTCSVTENADKECKDVVQKALKVSPNAFVVIVGCYAQLKPEEIAKIEGVDLVLGAKEKFKILEFLNDMEKKSFTEIHACEINEVNEFVPSYSINDRTRVFLKVQDGCDYNCSFCTIPLARGKSRSNSVVSVLEDLKKIEQKNIKEVVLTGINLGDFGKGLTGGKKREETFFELIKAIEQESKIPRFRISSIEPNLLTDEIIDFVANSQKFMPHFHIPLQSGNDEVLGWMRRRYKTELYTSRIKRIKEKMPHACIGVDVIVGFPGETNEHFLSTYSYLNELEVDYLHVFTYSERANTLAAEMQEVVPYAIRKQRNNMLRILSAKKQRQFYEKYENQIATVLFEAENKNGFLSGYSENYIRVKIPFQKELINTLQTVTAEKTDADGLVKATLLQPILQ